LREAARRVCKPEEIIGAIGLINHLGKTCFVQGLHNERIQTIVRILYFSEKTKHAHMKMEINENATKTNTSK
jgi:hypothetical protein